MHPEIADHSTSLSSEPFKLSFAASLLVDLLPSMLAQLSAPRSTASNYQAPPRLPSLPHLSPTANQLHLTQWGNQSKACYGHPVESPCEMDHCPQRFVRCKRAMHLSHLNKGRGERPVCSLVTKTATPWRKSAMTIICGEGPSSLRSLSTRPHSNAGSSTMVALWARRRFRQNPPYQRTRVICAGSSETLQRQCKAPP